jgi:predicted porin
MEMSQTVSVVSGQAYDVSLWSRQAIYGNCDVTVTYNGASIFGFQPGLSYAEETGRIAAERTTGAEGVLRLSVQCGRGGFQARLWLDDVSMTQV